MIIVETSSSTETAEHGYAVTFEYVKAHGIHEAPVVLNALASENRRRFDERSPRLKHEAMTDLAEATHDFITLGVFSFMADVQKKSREKAGPGRLEEAFVSNTSHALLGLVHKSLAKYAGFTLHDANNEMRNVAGNASVITRTSEGLMALQMAHDLEAEVGFKPLPETPSRQVGFNLEQGKHHEIADS